jgi:hypothetical protein
VLGIAYGRDCPNAPQQGLGSEIALQAIAIGPDEWSASPGKFEIEGKTRRGVFLTRSKNKYGAGEKKRESWFYPHDELARLHVRFGGVKVS